MVAQMTPDLRTLLAPDRSVLLVIDFQNDFCHDDGVFGKAGLQLGAIQAAAENVLSFIEAARSAGVPIIFVKATNDAWTNTPAWVRRGTHKEEVRAEIVATGSWGAEFYRVTPGPHDRVIVKHRYSAFMGTSLEVVLRGLSRSTLLLTGTTTNVCVESTARDAFMRDYYVVLVEDCAGAPSKEEQEGTLHNMRTYFGHVTDSHAVAEVWRECVAR